MSESVVVEILMSLDKKVTKVQESLIMGILKRIDLS